MSVAASRLRTMLATPSGFYFSSAATGNGTDTTVVDSGVVKFDTTFLVNKWVRMLVATNATINGTSRRISSVSSGTITVTTAFAAATTSADTYEILPWDPTVYDDAIKRACRTSYPDLYLHVRDETLVVDSLLTNGTFETAVSGGESTGWTRVNTPTLTSETTIKIQGARSLKMVSSAGADRSVYQELTVRIEEVTTRTVKVRCWVYATAASTARIRVSLDGGSTFTSHAYHSGADQWEYQDLDVALTSATTSIRLYLETAASGTAYFDLAAAWIDPVNRYTLPTSLLSGPHFLSVQRDEKKPDGDYAPVSWRYSPYAGAVLRVEGMGQLTVPTADSSTVEITERQAEYLVAVAAEQLFLMLTGYDPGNKTDHLASAARWKDEAAAMRSKPGYTMRSMSAEVRAGWHTENDGETTYIILEGRIGWRW